jgi:hypothetical protein
MKRGTEAGQAGDTAKQSATFKSAGNPTHAPSASVFEMLVSGREILFLF